MVIGSQRFFLIAFISILTLLTILRLYFRVVTGDIRSAASRENEGLLPIIARCVFGMPLFASVFFHIFSPGTVPWSYLSLPHGFRTTGVLLGLVSLYGIYRVHRELGKYFSSTLVIREGHRLVRSGPYRLVRHPMYTSYFILFVAAFLVSENWVIGLSGTAVIATLMTLRLVKEEALLLEHFGEEYEQYRQTTGMFFPRTGSLVFRKETREESIFQ